MKTRKILFLFALVMIPFVGLFSQVVIPEDWKDLYDNYAVFFATAGGVAGIAMLLGELVIRLLKVTKKVIKIVLVWVLAVAASFAGAFVLKVGYLAEASLWETAIWGVFSGLIANGIWSTNLAFIKTFLEFIVGLIKAKVEAEVPEAE